jgi:hypothetical protein
LRTDREWERGRAPMRKPTSSQPIRYFSDLVTAPRTGSSREPRGATGAWLPALADDGLIKPVELAHLGVHIGVGVGEQASAFDAPGLHGAAGCDALADGGGGSPDRAAVLAVSLPQTEEVGMIAPRFGHRAHQCNNARSTSSYDVPRCQALGGARALSPALRPLSAVSPRAGRSA